jgi:helix-turn-helix protein
VWSWRDGRAGRYVDLAVPTGRYLSVEECVVALSARELWRILEPVHGMIYFVPEAQERFAALGLDRMAGYFASRAAALGPVPGEVVVATFYNFNPVMVHAAVPAAWSVTSPAALVEARYEAAGAALRRGLGELASGDDVAELAELVRGAAERACGVPQGRPLFAAHAALEWPSEPLLVLWHGQTLLREFRGDGHVAALLLEGLSGIEALVVHAASGEVSAEALRRSRGWSEVEWSAAVEGLRSRGVLDASGALSAEGLELRGRVEGVTDSAASVAYSGLGEGERERFVELARPLSRAVVGAGMLPFAKR